MEPVNTYGYSLDELKKIASENPSQVDTMGYSLDELKQIASQAPPDPRRDLGFGNVEQKMQQPLPERPNPFMQGAEAVKGLSLSDFIPGNIQGMGKQGMALLHVLGAPYQALESSVANSALRAQQQGDVVKGLSAFLNPFNQAKDLVSGFTGPQRTIGDVNYRAGLNRPTADLAGLAQNIVVQAPELVQGGVNLAKYGIGGIAKGSKNLSQYLGDVFTSGGKLKTAQGELGALKVGGEQLTQDIARANSAYDKAVESLHGASVSDAQSYKSALPELSKANSKVYRKGLDIAETKLSESQSSVKKLVDDAIAEAGDQGITSGSVVDKLKQMSKDLTPINETSFDYATASNQSKLVDKPVSVTDLRDFKNEIYKAANESGKPADEVASAIFQKHYGNKVASIDSNFAKMNAEYRPYAEAKNWAYRIFKPRTTEEITFGEQVLKRIAKGQGLQKDYDYLKILEEGSGRFKGTRNLRPASTSVATELQNIDKQIELLRVQKVQSTGDIAGMKTQVQKLESLKRQRNWIAVGALSGLLGISGTGKAVVKGATDVLS